MISHFAYIVLFDVIAVKKLNGVVQAESAYHPANTCPLFVGSVGLIAVSPSYTT